ncbi:hypothetical protein ACFWFQ_29645 [Nocardia salmonicida]|uniref:hypothetical protein n=1 Tax=Nocardia salmonicida TaxID=53431 RepID=UPI00364CB50F
MNKFRAISAAVMVASGLMLSAAGTASAGTGSGESLIDLVDLLGTGSGGSGSSFGITLGEREGEGDDAETVADTPVSTGSAGMGSGSAPLCSTGPTTPGCPK